MTKKNILILTGILAIVFSVFAVMPQEAKVNQRKIDREHKKKEKQAQEEYEKAIKRHRDMQSKETQQMMKQTKKESRKKTPLK